MTDTIIPENAGNNEPEPTEVTTQRLYQRGILDAAAEAGWKPYKLGGQLGWRYPIYRLDGSPFTDSETGENVYRWKNANRDAKPKYRWVSRQSGCPPYYFLPEIQESIQDADGTAYLVNGEPAVLAMNAAGLSNAFCYFNGEGSTPSDLAAFLKELGVTYLVHIPDKDNTGSNSVRKVAQLLMSTGIEYLAIRLPDHLPAKADVNDLWIDCEFAPDLFTNTITTLTQNSEHWLPIKPVHPELNLPDQLGFSFDAIPDQVDDTPYSPKSDSSNRKLPQAFLAAIPSALNAVRQGNGWSQNIPCIFHHHEHDDSRPGAGWDFEKHIFHCFKRDETWNAIETGKQLGLNWHDHIENSPSHRNQTSSDGATPNMNTHKYDVRQVAKRIPPPPPPPSQPNYQAHREAARTNRQAENRVGWEQAGTIEMSDMGNAQRLLVHYGSQIKFSLKHKAWLIYTGTHWRWDSLNRIMEFAKETARSIWDEVKTELDQTRQGKLTKHALVTQSLKSLKAMVETATSESGIAVEPEDLDTDDWLLNFTNGTVDLRNGELRAHNPDDLITKIIPYDFNPDFLQKLREKGIEALAEIAPYWYGFLTRTQMGKMEVVRYITKLVGYTATGDTSHKCIVLLQGPKDTGKTLFLQTVAHALGMVNGSDKESYSKNTPFDTFAAKDNARTNQANDFVVDLAGARMAYADEGKEQQGLDTALLKQASGRSPLKARPLYGKPFFIRPTFKIWMATNHRPDIPADDDAIWERVKLIPFVNTIPAHEKNEKLESLIRNQELPAIAASIVYGCELWQKEGLAVPEAVRTATQEYQNDQDTFKQWLEERCEFVMGDEVTALTKFTQDYRDYCKDNRRRMITSRIFTDRLLALEGVGQATARSKQKGVTGLTLIQPTEPTQG